MESVMLSPVLSNQDSLTISVLQKQNLKPVNQESSDKH